MTMLTKFNDQEIIEGLRNRDEAIINHIYETYPGLVRSVLIRTGASSDLVDDVFQDTILAIMDYVLKPSFKLRRKFKSLICSMARYTYLKLYRSRQVEIPVDVMPEGKYEDQALMEIIFEEKRIRKEKLENLRKRLANLPEDHHELIRLKFFQQLKYREIALLRNPDLNGPPIQEAALKKVINRLKAQIHYIINVMMANQKTIN